MKRPGVYVVLRDLPKPNRIPVNYLFPLWSVDHLVAFAHRLASGSGGRWFRSYVEIVDEGRSTADLRWSGTHTSATSTRSSAAGWIAGHELGSDF